MPKDHRVTLYVNQHQDWLIWKAAQAKGLSVSEYCRQVMLRSAKRTLTEARVPWRN